MTCYIVYICKIAYRKVLICINLIYIYAYIQLEYFMYIYFSEIRLECKLVIGYNRTIYIIQFFKTIIQYFSESYIYIQSNNNNHEK